MSELPVGCSLTQASWSVLPQLTDNYQLPPGMCSALAYLELHAPRLTNLELRGCGLLARLVLGHCPQ